MGGAVYLVRFQARSGDRGVLSRVRLCSGVPTPRRLVPDLRTHQGCEWRFTAARPPGSCDGRSRQLLCGACGVWPSRVPLPVGF